MSPLFSFRENSGILCIRMFKFRFIELFKTAYSVGEGQDPPLLGVNYTLKQLAKLEFAETDETRKEHCISRGVVL